MFSYTDYTKAQAIFDRCCAAEWYRRCFNLWLTKPAQNGVQLSPQFLSTRFSECDQLGLRVMGAEQFKIERWAPSLIHEAIYQSDTAEIRQTFHHGLHSVGMDGERLKRCFEMGRVFMMEAIGNRFSVLYKMLLEGTWITKVQLSEAPPNSVTNWMLTKQGQSVTPPPSPVVEAEKQEVVETEKQEVVEAEKQEVANASKKTEEKKESPIKEVDVFIDEFLIA